MYLNTTTTCTWNLNISTGGGLAVKWDDLIVDMRKAIIINTWISTSLIGSLKIFHEDIYTTGSNLHGLRTIGCYGDLMNEFKMATTSLSVVWQNILVISGL